MLQRSVMLNDRANTILEAAAKITIKELGHQIYPDGTVLPFDREVEIELDKKVELLDWQCRRIQIDEKAFTEFVQADSKDGPMNFAYLALLNEAGVIIDESLWTAAEIDATEERFSLKAALED